MELQRDSIEIIREIVSRVAGKDVSSLGVDEPLGLDSINRISLLVELEHAFQKPLDPEQVTPEAFDTLSSLAALMNSLD